MSGARRDEGASGWIGEESVASPCTVYQRYRTRFGVEASYRTMHRTRARMSSQNPAVRLVLFGVALLIENEWVSSPGARGWGGVAPQPAQVGPFGFEPKSKAPKAPRIPSYPTDPRLDVPRRAP